MKDKLAETQTQNIPKYSQSTTDKLDNFPQSTILDKPDNFQKYSQTTKEKLSYAQNQIKCLEKVQKLPEKESPSSPLPISRILLQTSLLSPTSPLSEDEEESSEEETEEESSEEETEEESSEEETDEDENIQPSFAYGNELKTMKCEKAEDWSDTFEKRVYKYTNRLKQKFHPA
jgi:hypothetical protein